MLVRHEDKMTSVFNIALCAVLLQIVPVITHVLRLNPSRVHTPESASCAQACTLSLQHASHAYARKGLSPIYVPITCLLLRLDLCVATKAGNGIEL